MIFRIIDLRKKTMSQARKIMKRLRQFREDKHITKPINFLLPSKHERSRRNKVFQIEKIYQRCPYCSSPLQQTESGIKCTQSNIRKVIRDIEDTKRRWGKNAELFLSKRANRFYDEYTYAGRDMSCEYVFGNEEHRFMVRPRILMKGVDRKKIFGGST